MNKQNMKPYIVSTFLSNEDDSEGREYTVFGKENAERLYQEKINTGAYAMVRIDGATTNNGVVEYDRKGKLKSWYSPKANWLIRDDKYLVPFFVYYEEEEVQDRATTAIERKLIKQQPVNHEYS